jgi:uncharacterized protein YkwD
MARFSPPVAPSTLRSGVRAARLGLVALLLALLLGGHVDAATNAGPGESLRPPPSAAPADPADGNEGATPALQVARFLHVADRLARALIAHAALEAAPTALTTAPPAAPAPAQPPQPSFVAAAPARPLVPAPVAATPVDPPAITAPQAPAPTPVPSVQPAPLALNERESLFVGAMNDARRAQGLSPLRVDASLTEVARRRSQDMSTTGYFAHVSPTGETWLTLVAAAGLRLTAGGENLARVSGDPLRSVTVATEKLLQSPSHRANIMETRYTRVGVGAATGADGVTVFTSIFAN